jgi:hypothetical protein
MNANDETSQFTVVWQTVAALIITVIMFTILSFIANFIVVIIGAFATEEDHEQWTQITRAVTPSFIGVLGSRYVCDLFVPQYSRRSIFVFLTTLELILIASALSGRKGMNFGFIQYLSCAVVIASAFFVFWKDTKFD